jgi:hypothetical protein
MKAKPQTIRYRAIALL